MRALRTEPSRLPREEPRNFSSTLQGPRSRHTSKTVRVSAQRGAGRPTGFEGTARATRAASVHHVQTRAGSFS